MWDGVIAWFGSKEMGFYSQLWFQHSTSQSGGGREAESLTHWQTFWRTTGKISGKRSCLQEPPEGVALESPGKTCAPRTKQMAGIAVVLT